MFGQIIDLLIKQEDDKKRIFFLTLKILFTSIIVAKWYSNLFGHYSIISVTDSIAIIDFFIHGTAFICFVLFFLVWVVSYSFTSFVLMNFSAWASLKLYLYVSTIVLKREYVMRKISARKILKCILDYIIDFFIVFEVIEVENSKKKLGLVFYKVYYLLKDVENERTSMEHEEFTDKIGLVIQFLIIYKLLDFHFLSSSIALLTIMFLVFFLIILSSFVAIVVATLVEFRHRHLLELMDILDDEYGTKKGQTNPFTDRGE